MSLSRAVYIVAAKRTAFGTFGGRLKGVSATKLGELSAIAALEAGKVDPAHVDTVVYGSVLQAAGDAIYIARHIGLRAGVPQEVPALTVNRLCASGFESIAAGAKEIILGEAEIALVGGSDNMSQAPYVLRDARWGTRFGTDLKLEDSLWSGLTDAYCKLPMAITAENLAKQYKITREECDEFALKSQLRWQTAHEAGNFAAEIAPITLKGRKGPEEFTIDEHPRPQTTPEGLAKLAPVFAKDGVVTAGNASGICDGAVSLVLASEEAIKKHNLSPLARIVATKAVGVNPSIMGIGPAPAVRQALDKAGLELKDMDLIEVNEAFAPQYLAVEKELGLNPEITNACGGAIALGHPLAASGSRITSHLVHELRRQGLRYAVGSACVGGGQGMAIIIENMK